MSVEGAKYSDVVEWRRDLHAHPELQFDVHRTASLVAAKLRAFGCDEVATEIGKTGVVGIIHEKKGPAAGSSACGPIWADSTYRLFAILEHFLLELENKPVIVSGETVCRAISL